ncbi:MAG: phosphate acetyltransferase [Andreesenia angusta]|nr:phosphate acetyltransferase [Andreesenia angusta]
MDLFIDLKKKIEGKNLKIVFPESEDIRILKAVSRLNKEKLLIPILLGKSKEVEKLAKKDGIDIEGIEIIDPENSSLFEDMVKAFVERRKGKNTEEDGRRMLKDANYFGTMLVYMDKADGMVSGAVHSTGDTVRPALQIVKTKPNISRTSGAFIMIKDDKKYLFADCAINVSLTEEQLAEIAVESANTAELFGIDPKIAMLSFSTFGSAKAEEATKVENATKLAKEMSPNLNIDGEMQFDAAIVPEVGRQKAPDSKIAGNANVFIFPSLEAGNIGYKIAQRLGEFEAIGPILQGLNKPISDLSRGCNEEDVYKLSLITAAQSLI